MMDNKSVLSGLNEKQFNAVISEAKRNLVLAGAGSGKTKTVISKLLHLVREKNVKPSSIMAITFTKNAANEMIDRLIISNDITNTYESFIQNKSITKNQKDAERKLRVRELPWINNLTIRTFHSLCYKILRDHGNPVFDNKFKLIVDGVADEDIEITGTEIIATEKPKDIIGKILVLACNDRDYFLKLKRYILDYYVDKVSMHKEMKSLSQEGQKTYTTLRGESVKSKSERDIADWLFRHNIKYVYEKITNLKDFNFKPDFFIPQANLYLEHVTDKSYNMENKEKQFIISGKNCVITYENIMSNSMLFNLAMERIVMGKITEEITEEVSLSYEEEFKSYHDKVNDFLKTVMRLQSMIKAEDLNTTELLNRASKSDHERIRIFYELAVPLIESYKKYCINKSYVDFDDLILLTVQLLKQNQEVREFYQTKYRYLMVDEFQDVNGLQVKLLDLLLKNDSQLFCVGDDWQSIYGFRGSDVDYIVNFEKHYPNCEIHKLDVNYRSTQSIVGASNEVIKYNKNQIQKEVKSFKNSLSKIEIFRANNKDEDGIDFFIEKVRELYENGYNKDDILVLYRRSKMFTPYYNALKSNHLHVSYKTIHASKGLEAKAVFIIGLTEGNGGFPDIWLDDAIFRVVKDVKYDFLLEEERRLFYVALTRAKEELILITELGNESTFIDEIPNQYFNLNTPELKITSEINCLNCGGIVDKSDKFCKNCGTSLIEKTSNLKLAENKSYYEKVRELHPKAYLPWTIEDDNKLKELYLKGVSVEKLSEIMGRKIGAIYSRIQKLEID